MSGAAILGQAWTAAVHDRRLGPAHLDPLSRLIPLLVAVVLLVCSLSILAYGIYALWREFGADAGGGGPGPGGGGGGGPPLDPRRRRRNRRVGPRGPGGRSRSDRVPARRRPVRS